MRLADPGLPSDRKFGFFVAAVAAILSAWLLVRVSGIGAFAALVLASASAAMAILRPSSLRPFNRAWMFLGQVLGAFMSPIVMGVLFFGVITPIAMLMRLAGRDELRLKAAKGATCWRERALPGQSPKSLRRQY